MVQSKTERGLAFDRIPSLKDHIRPRALTNRAAGRAADRATSELLREMREVLHLILTTLGKVEPADHGVGGASGGSLGVGE